MVYVKANLGVNSSQNGIDKKYQTSSVGFYFGSDNNSD